MIKQFKVGDRIQEAVIGLPSKDPLTIQIIHRTTDSIRVHVYSSMQNKKIEYIDRPISVMSRKIEPDWRGEEDTPRELSEVITIAGSWFFADRSLRTSYLQVHLKGKDNLTVQQFYDIYRACSGLGRIPQDYLLQDLVCMEEELRYNHYRSEGQKEGYKEGLQENITTIEDQIYKTLEEKFKQKLKSIVESGESTPWKSIHTVTYDDGYVLLSDGDFNQPSYVGRPTMYGWLMPNHPIGLCWNPSPKFWKKLPKFFEV